MRRLDVWKQVAHTLPLLAPMAVGFTAVVVVVVSRLLGSHANGLWLRVAGFLLALVMAFHLDGMDAELEGATSVGLGRTIAIRSAVVFGTVSVLWANLTLIAASNPLNLGIGMEAFAYTAAAWGGALWGERHRPRSGGIVGGFGALLAVVVGLVLDAWFEMYPISAFQDDYLGSRVRWGGLSVVGLALGLATFRRR